MAIEWAKSGGSETWHKKGNAVSILLLSSHSRRRISCTCRHVFLRSFPLLVTSHYLWIWTVLEMHPLNSEIGLFPSSERNLWPNDQDFRSELIAHTCSWKMSFLQIEIFALPGFLTNWNMHEYYSLKEVTIFPISSFHQEKFSNVHPLHFC